ncbi:hypothetical protein Pelo_19354 [Pelomyxa schiedti]|nr:hypothetical protein Pelo_19354 [Pelomyxa schiedti]
MTQYCSYNPASRNEVPIQLFVLRPGAAGRAGRRRLGAPCGRCLVPAGTPRSRRPKTGAQGGADEVGPQGADETGGVAAAHGGHHGAPRPAPPDRGRRGQGAHLVSDGGADQHINRPDLKHTCHDGLCTGLVRHVVSWVYHP